MSRSRRVWLSLLAVALLAAPASADVFHVTLTNGSVIQSSSQPQQAAWDPNMILLLTEVGNWVGFPKDDIESIRAEDPTEGFGVRINDNAIALGLSPNDLPQPAEQNPQQQLNDRLLQLTERMLEQAERQQNYSIQQFVEPGQTQGIPSSFGGVYTGDPSGLLGNPGGIPVGPAPVSPGPVTGTGGDEGVVNPPQ